MAWAKRALIAIAMLASVVIAASDPYTIARREFMQAYAAINPTGTAATNITSSSADDSAALQAYMLYPYLQAARLQRALVQVGRDVAAVDQSIKAFLAKQNGSLAGRELRRGWLLDLAARQLWPELLANLPANGIDAELRCLAMTAQLSVSPPVSPDAAALRGLWLSTERLPTACNAPFEAARSAGIISSDLIEQRARLVLKAGNTALARELAEMLPASRAAPLKQWASLIEKPAPAIDALVAHPTMSIEADALQDGWTRLARKDQDAAIKRLPGLMRARHLTDGTASPFVLNLALALSWSRRDEALSYFDRVKAADFSDQTHEWRTRAALWAGKWTQVQQYILAMPEALRGQARWRYWLARADEQLNDPKAARAIYEALVAGDDNYYAAMAAAKVSVAYTPHQQPMAVDDNLTQALLKLAGMQRAHELLAVQLRNEATAEWNQVFVTLQPGEHLAAAQLAHDWAWYDQAVATTAKLGLFNDYEFLYPRPYDPEVNAAATLSGLSTDLIYGVMRQETLFRADAQSSANARGLLQLVPETARLTARKFKLPVPSPDDLFNPVVNVPLGALNLSTLIDDFDGQLVLALAAYNAGPVAARRWLPSQAMAADIWVENIPYNETRNYVQKVLWHSLVFRWLRDGKPVATQAWQVKVQP